MTENLNSFDSLLAWWVQTLGLLWSFGNFCCWMDPSKSSWWDQSFLWSQLRLLLGFVVTGPFSRCGCFKRNHDTQLTSPLVSLIIAKVAQSFDAKFKQSCHPISCTVCPNTVLNLCHLTSRCLQITHLKANLYFIICCPPAEKFVAFCDRCQKCVSNHALSTAEQPPWFSSLMVCCNWH